MPRGVPNAKTTAAKLAVGEVPTTATSGQTYDSTEDNAPVQLPENVSPLDNPGDALLNPALADLNRLHNFLMLNYPAEFSRTNRQKSETAVEIAMRLLSGVSNSKQDICPAQYCNLAAKHQGTHGWIQATRL